MKTKKYRVLPKKKVDLKEFDTSYKGELIKEQVVQKLMPENLSQMTLWQEKFYAENKQGLVVVLQAMDAAGKDGLIKHVFTALNPQGVQVTPFKQPNSEELDHDYLWRINRALPRRGNIAIFNRSHYEDVLITRVHNLLQAGQLPENLIDEKIWERRFKEIVNFEKYLTENGIRVVKLFLHVSKDEQKERLLSRIDEPDKNWKFSSGDIHERKYWDKYQKAYEDLLSQTSTEEAPWYVIPADRKWYARYLVSQVIVEIMEDMNPKFPELPEEERKELGEWRKLLIEE